MYCRYRQRCYNGRWYSKGKISQKDINLLRRGVDAYLDEKQTVAALTADITSWYNADKKLSC